MASATFDVVVIGSGVGGYPAAIRAAQNLVASTGAVRQRERASRFGMTSVDRPRVGNGFFP